MKKHQFILVSSAIFTLLFYDQSSLGINFAIFGLFLTFLICFFYQDKLVTKTHLVLVITSILSCLAFAWYADLASFFALALSLIILQFKTQEQELKTIQVIPLLFLNGIASVVRIFNFSQWLPKQRVHNNFLKKTIAYFLIPVVFLGLFFSVYSFGSEHFSTLFTNYYLDVDVVELFWISLIGFYLSFAFWNYWVPETCYEKNVLLENDFDKEMQNTNKRSFSFLDIDFERKSGEITLVLLNVMLLIFIITYNYEQFFEVVEVSKLSSATHERVNSVIFSIIMAVAVILFYFKGGFNFDSKANKLSLLAQIWIVLNGVLIISTIIKNSEYVMFYGLTYKRLGVYAFLILAIIGLVFTFVKIVQKKTNAFILNQMIWYFYGTIILCSFVNWGNLITRYNIVVNKGTEANFLLHLNFNDELRDSYFKEHNVENVWADYKLQDNQKKPFLSRALYYEFKDL